MEAANARERLPGFTRTMRPSGENPSTPGIAHSPIPGQMTALCRSRLCAIDGCRPSIEAYSRGETALKLRHCSTSPAHDEVCPGRLGGFDAWRVAVGSGYESTAHKSHKTDLPTHQFVSDENGGTNRSDVVDS